jgi:hypothetical protein
MYLFSPLPSRSLYSLFSLSLSLSLCVCVCVSFLSFSFSLLPPVLSPPSLPPPPSPPTQTLDRHTHTQATPALSSSLKAPALSSSSQDLDYGVIASLSQRECDNFGGAKHLVLLVLAHNNWKWKRLLYPEFSKEQKKWAVTTLAGVMSDGVHKVTVQYSPELGPPLNSKNSKKRAVLSKLEDLTEGAVLRVDCVPQYFLENGTDPNCPWMMRLLVSDFVVMRQMAPDYDVPWMEVDAPRELPPVPEDARLTSKWGPVGALGMWEPVAGVSCWGDFCSKSGSLIQDRCIVASHGRLDLDSVERLAPETTKLQKTQRENPKTMENRGRRFVLYYYYATFVFGFFERTRLPLCVEAAIRSAFPNAAGDAYVGYRDA